MATFSAFAPLSQPPTTYRLLPSAYCRLPTAHSSSPLEQDDVISNTDLLTGPQG